MKEKEIPQVVCFSHLSYYSLTKGYLPFLKYFIFVLVRLFHNFLQTLALEIAADTRLSSGCHYI